MLVQDSKKIEKEYFVEKNSMVIPKLLCAYYEQGDYELTYFLAKDYVIQFGEAEFYVMMSLVQMGYINDANLIYKKHKEDWFHLFKQYNIYWKHIVLFALFFKEFHISDEYQFIFDIYFENPFVQLLEMAQTEPIYKLMKTDLYVFVEKQHFIIQSLWKEEKEKKSHKLITFEDIKWNLWKRQNENIQNGKKYGIEEIYNDNDIKIYSYKPKTVSASMHILTDDINTIILDCGCEISGIETIRIQVKELLNYFSFNELNAVFISHAHMDHYGSLNEIRKYKVYMTEITKQLIRLSSPDVALNHVQILKEYGSVDINGIKVSFIPNGHILGSVMMDVNWKNKKRIVYTGDYSIENQCTVKGFNVEDLKMIDNRKIDILITETTYGNRKEMFKLSEYEKIFVQYCQKQIIYKNKIIIPCFAIGRVQEVAILLSDLVKEVGAKILIDGMAANITQYYQLLMERNILSKNIAISASEFEVSEKIMNNDIILASSGMLKEGSMSAKYIQELLDRENVCIMKVGFIHEKEHLLMSILNRKNKNIHYVDIPLSAHVDYQSLIETTEILAADCVLYVHGSGIVK